MPTHRVTALCNTMVQAINSWAKKEHWTLTELILNKEKEGVDKSVNIRGTSNDGRGYEASWTIVSEGEEECFVDMNTTLGVRKLAHFLLLSMALIIIIYVFLHTLVNMPSDYRKLSGSSVLVFFGSYLLGTYFPIKLSREYKRNHNKLREIEASFDSYVEKNFRYEIISGIDPLVFPTKFYLALNFIYFCGLIFLSQMFNFMVAIVFAIVLLVFQFPNNLKKLVKKDPYLYWKSVIISIANGLSVFSFIVISLSFILLFINSVAINFAYNVLKKEGIIGNIAKIDFAAHVFGRNLDELQSYNFTVLNASYAKPETLSIGLIVFVMGSCLLVWWVSTRGLLKHIEEWRRIIGSKQDSVPLIPPAVYSLYSNREKLVTLFVSVNYAGLFFVNTLGLILSVEGISYCLTGQGLIFKPSAVIFSWLLTYNYIFPSSPIKYIVYMFMLVLTLPVFLLVFFSLLRIGRILFPGREQSRVANEKTLGTEIVYFIQQVCTREGLNVPEVIVTKNKGILVTARGKLFSKNNCLSITDEALHNLDIKELKAVIAHELGHVKQGLRKMEVYRLLSSLALIPNYYLSLVLNPSELEFKADEFSVSTTRDKDALVNALIKAEVYRVEGKENSSNKFRANLPKVFYLDRVGKWLEKVAVSLKLLSGEMLLGYSHPPLSHRLADIRRLRS